ncbi:MAG TPA: hypothetical protein VII55_01330 [Candidatus Saccharimonadales bacterium]
MAGETGANPYLELEQPISEALDLIAAVAGGNVEFGPEAAHLSYAAGDERPASQPAAVRYLGETVGSLKVVIFEPFDGTGNRIDRSDRPVYDAARGFFPETARIKARMYDEAQAVHGDVHLAVASFRGEQPNFDPRLLAGSLSLFGRFGVVAEIGYLGQDNLAFGNIMAGKQTPAPAVTQTVKPDRLNHSFSRMVMNRPASDFRAVYNRYPGVSQVAGFITLNRDEKGGVSRAQADMLHRLGTVQPVQARLA